MFTWSRGITYKKIGKRRKRLYASYIVCYWGDKLYCTTCQEETGKRYHYVDEYDGSFFNGINIDELLGGIFFRL